MSTTELNILIIVLITMTVTLLLGYYEKRTIQLESVISDLKDEIADLSCYGDYVTAARANQFTPATHVPLDDWLGEPPFNLVDTSHRFNQLRRNNDPIYWGD